LTSFPDILLEHLKRYPLMEVQDLYKLTYQAALGCEHAVVDLEQAHGWLQAELTGLPVGPDEPLIDFISPDGCIARIHLRPFMVYGGDMLQLSRVFLQSAGQYHGTVKLLQKYYQAAIDLSREDRLPFRSHELLGFLSEMEGEGFPAVHHSTTFEGAYKPAYRVIIAQLYPFI
jgi:hypothetical protein